MRTTWELLIGFFIVNLSVGLVMGLALPGTDIVGNGPPLDSNQIEQYQQQYNASKIVGTWTTGGNPFTGIPLIGDIFNGLIFAWQNIQYILNGLPMFLQWIAGSYITDMAAYNSFMVISYALEAIYGFMIVWFIVSFISGRVFE
jgi:hypothetical protein